MDISEIQKNIVKISDKYAKNHNIKRDNDWYILKIHEEIGELTKAYLKLTNRARKGDQSDIVLKEELEKEFADCIGQLILFADKEGINITKALETKRFKYLEE